MDLGIEKGHIAGLQIFLLNLSLALTLGLFAGLAMRALVLLVIDHARPAVVMGFRALAAAAFLAFGFFDFLFSSNIQVWDRPSRALMAACSSPLPVGTCTW